MINKRNILLIYFLILIEALILFNSKIIINSVIESSKIFIFKIFPSLFPTMIVGLCLVKLNINSIIPKFIKKLFRKLFNFNDALTSIYIVSMITGTPSNSMYINEYIDKGLINEKEGIALLSCTHFINPLFVIGGVGIGVFNSSKVGFILLIMLYISNFIKAFLNRNNFSYMDKKVITQKSESFIKVLISSIKSAMSSLLMILGIVITFNILVSLLVNIFDLPYIFNALLNGLLEMTGGIIKLSSLDINIYLKLFIAYYFLSFGGICIWMQTLSMLENKKIKYFKYFIFRVI